jgi:hypothetical protein
MCVCVATSQHGLRHALLLTFMCAHARACIQGTYLETLGNDDATDCLSCPAGTFSNTEGASAWYTCQPCDPGSYTSTEGQHQCALCQAGYSTTPTNAA